MIETWENINWKFIHKRYRTPLYSYILWDGISHHYNKQITFPYEMSNWLNLDSDLMVDKSEWQRVQNLAIEAIYQNPKFLLEVTNIAYSINDEIIKFVKNIFEQSNFTNLNNNQLADIFSEYINLNLQAASFMLFPMFFDEYLESRIKESVKKSFNADEIDGVMHIFTTALKPGSAQEEGIALVKLANKKEMNPSDIKNFIIEFGWLKNTSMSGDFYEPNEINQRITDLANNNPAAKLEEIETEHKDFIDKLNTYKSKIDDETKILVDALQEAIYFRSWRTERIYRNAQYMEKFFNEISDRIGLKDHKDLFFLLPSEIIQVLSTQKIDQDIISERKKGFILFADGDETKIFSGSIVDEAKKKVNYLDKVINTKVIEGRCAFPGQVKAEAVVITSKNDFNKMKDGCILVSHSTTPDYVPVIRRCSAIVTDEGGILSHASVISRELKIPCVIGTKNATSIIKNGDTIDLDADKGLVKIIK